MMRSGSQVLIVDDDPAIRAALRRLLQASGYEVWTLQRPDDGLYERRPDVPCCMVLDVCMPGQSGLEVQAAMAARGLRIPIIFLTGRGDIAMGVGAMKAGAVDFLTKPVQEATLLAAVERALRLDAQDMERRRNLETLRGRYRCLTPREQQVMLGVTAGKLNKQIAADLGIVEKTIKVHRARVMEKMNAESLADLVRFSEALLADEEPAGRGGESAASVRQQISRDFVFA